MFISAFTMARNADKFYFPMRESIGSVLPIADEVIVALAKGDEDDRTEYLIREMNNPKIRIIPRVWDPALFAESKIFAHETTFALNQCKGTWCIYLQADEVLHEDGLAAIVDACKKYEHDLGVDGLLLSYVHLWGDYNHVLDTHGLIRNEIRVVRNHIGCYSYKDAVSFRKGNDEKLRVVKIPSRIFHYGYIRPPHIMGKKTKVHHEIHQGNELHGDKVENPGFDWGPIGGLQKLKGAHPEVMREFVAKFNWPESLNYAKPSLLEKSSHKHLRLKNRFMTWVERNFNNNEELLGFKNYVLLKR